MTPKQYQEKATPEYFKKMMPAQMAEQRANELGISKDDMFKLYSSITQSGSPVQGMPGGSPYGSNAMQWTPTTTTGPGGTVTTASPLQQQAAQMLQQKKVADAMGWYQPPPQQAQQPQMPQLAPAQQTPTVQTTALKASTPYGTTGNAAPVIPAASAQNITPMFNPMQQPQLGVQPLQSGQYAPPPLPTLPSYQPQPQWFQSGGLVTGDQQQNPQGANIQPSSQASNTGIYNPSYLGSYLGALALGQPMIVNPQPSGTPSAKSGTSPVGGPQYYSTGGGSFQLPSGDILTQDQMNALDPGSIRELQRGVGLGTVKYLTAQQAGPAAQGPWAQMPGIFKKADMPTIGGSGVTQLTATPQANAALMPKAGPAPTYAPQVSAPMPAGVNVGAPTQFAPPPAPGAATSGFAVGAPPPQQPPAMRISQSAMQSPQALAAAHASALADAGKAMYTHFGGDPNTATHADIANFHQELQGALAGGPPIKRRSGGIVPGRGNNDTVPAMLTPGEFVMNKNAVQDIGVGNLQAMNTQHFQGGGSVLPREAAHKAVSDPSQYSAPAAPSSPDSGQGQQTTSGNPFAPSSNTTQGPAWQGYLDRGGNMSALGTSAYQAPAGSSALTVGDVARGAAIPGGGVTQSLGQAPGGGAASAIGGIASAISSAAQKYAESIGSWKPQPSHIPDPSSYRRAPTPTLSTMET